MPNNPYETEALVSQYLLFHYGNDRENLPWDFGPMGALDYPTRIVSENLDPEALPENARALDIGCAVGRTSLELSRHCAEVIGIDYSSAFIQAARTVAEQGSLSYTFIESGSRTTSTEAKLPEGCHPSRVQFEVGDAMDLRADLGDFDLVVAANLLCRLPEPLRFLDRLPHLVRTGGTFILTTPQTWLEEYTPTKKWIGATPETGTTHKALLEILSPHFELTARHDMPFLIREHLRKYQWSVAEATVWRRA